MKAKLKPKTQILISEILGMTARMLQINHLELNTIDFVDNDGKVIDIDVAVIEKWRYGGLNNMDFITSGAYMQPKNLSYPVKYIRLLTYENACNVIDFINKNNSDDYAYITPGGVTTQVSKERWNIVENYIKTLNARYEITLEHPEVVAKQIISNLKSKGII